MRRRHNAQAAVVLERAARLEPGKGSILEALGRACFTSGQYERARETFEALLEVDPSSHYGHYALGRSLKNLGRPREARTHLRLAVALSPTTAMYRAALARLPPPEGAASPEPGQAPLGATPFGTRRSARSDLAGTHEAVQPEDAEDRLRVADLAGLDHARRPRRSPRG